VINRVSSAYVNTSILRRNSKPDNNIQQD